MIILRGIDVSEDQGTIDWEQVKGQIDFAILRAGYGENVIDSQFVRNITECSRLNIPVGAYWFSYALDPEMARAEALYCLDAIRPYKVDFPVAFDFEYASIDYATQQGVDLTPLLVRQLAVAFLEEIGNAGYFAVNYTNDDLINQYFGDLDSTYGLWLANWPQTVNAADPPMPCIMWQWGGAFYDGISGRTDSDFCYRDFTTGGGDDMTGEEILTALNEYLSTQPLPDWAAQEFEQAVDLGITDGTNPMELTPRYQAAIMAKRAYEKAKEKN